MIDKIKRKEILDNISSTHKLYHSRKLENFIASSKWFHDYGYRKKVCKFSEQFDENIYIGFISEMYHDDTIRSIIHYIKKDSKNFSIIYSENDFTEYPYNDYIVFVCANYHSLEKSENCFINYFNKYDKLKGFI